MSYRKPIVMDSKLSVYFLFGAKNGKMFKNHPPWRISYCHSIFLIVSGNGSFSTEEKTIKLNPGMFLYLPAGKLHCFTQCEAFKSNFFDWYFWLRKQMTRRENYFFIPSMDWHFEKSKVSPPVKLTIETCKPVSHLSPWLQLIERFIDFNILESQDIYDQLKQQSAFQLFIHQFLHFMCEPTDLVIRESRRS